MRTKTWFLTAAAVAAGLFSSQGQSNVYSVNVVGYVNVAVPTNKYVIASAPFQFTGEGGNYVTNVVAGVIPDGTTLLKFNKILGGFDDAETFFEGFGWFPGTTLLEVGDGFFVQTPPGAAGTLTMTGQVAQGANTNALAGGYTLVGAQVPQSLPLGMLDGTAATNTFVFPAVDGDQILMWDTVAQGYKDAIVYFDGYGWFDPGPFGPGPVEGPSPTIGEGFFVQKASGTNWVRSFTVTP